MEQQISKERATEIIGCILEKREEAKNIKAYITGAKEELETFLNQNDLTEYECEKGTVKIADSMREGLVKESVESAVTKVNAKEIDHIDMKDLYKEIDVHSISIKAKKGEF
ncbi:hypothetical protein NNC19_07330 [Clostridium sp. SHJSY1]|uniref:hypothetical protein n=1 Tax=Clostridium sp. SHJSY1 TaxID=2942483 RepID=UPI002875D634|nr:hypothetical protein [Clostridium sp. SHJSY1]MDS0525486.1 hypothetical protein [Clostridium sp. SHJSY1]